jgi:hypothetical protein
MQSWRTGERELRIQESSCTTEEAQQRQSIVFIVVVVVVVVRGGGGQGNYPHGKSAWYEMLRRALGSDGSSGGDGVVADILKTVTAVFFYVWR